MAAYVHLTADERLQIFAWHREHLPRAEIARRLARSPGTISRELRRNRVAAGYLPHRAQQCYHARRRRCRRRARFDDRRLRRLVLDLLQRGFSPEQIAGRLRAEQGATVINPETIYRFVYESPWAARSSCTSTCGAARRDGPGVRVAVRTASLSPGACSSMPGRRRQPSGQRSATGRAIRSASPRSKY
jgi:IS30 family transposase